MLLPEKEINHLKSEYRIRFAILLIFFLSAGVWLGIISLFPSYVISVTEEKDAVKQLNQLEGTTQAQSNGQIVSEISTTNQIISALQNAQDKTLFSSIVEDIATRRAAGVSINTFEFAKDNSTPGQTSIIINGLAATRASLVAFQTNLNNDPNLEKVVVPLSDLAQDSDIAFTLSLTYIQ